MSITQLRGREGGEDEEEGVEASTSDPEAWGIEASELKSKDHVWPAFSPEFLIHPRIHQYLKCVFKDKSPRRTLLEENSPKNCPALRPTSLRSIVHPSSTSAESLGILYRRKTMLECLSQIRLTNTCLLDRKPHHRMRTTVYFQETQALINRNNTNALTMNI